MAKLDVDMLTKMAEDWSDSTSAMLTIFAGLLMRELIGTGSSQLTLCLDDVASFLEDYSLDREMWIDEAEGGRSMMRINVVRKDAVSTDPGDLSVPRIAPGSSWSHVSGRAYRVIGLANENGDSRYPPTVIYYDTDGRWWARRVDDWHRSMTLVEEATSNETGIFENQP